MINHIKHTIWNFLQESLPKFTAIQDLRRELSDEKFRGEDRDAALKQMHRVLHTLHESMVPVVLFTGMLEYGDVRYTGFAFAVRAQVDAQNDYIINFQPDVKLHIQSLRILSGVYDIVECRWCNMDMLPSINAVFPYDGGEIFIDKNKGSVITPANRVFIRLRKRAEV